MDPEHARVVCASFGGAAVRSRPRAQQLVSGDPGIWILRRLRASLPSNRHRAVEPAALETGGEKMANLKPNGPRVRTREFVTAERRVLAAPKRRSSLPRPQVVILCAFRGTPKQTGKELDGAAPCICEVKVGPMECQSRPSESSCTSYGDFAQDWRGSRGRRIGLWAMGGSFN
jgi:hypothetical protein